MTPLEDPRYLVNRSSNILKLTGLFQYKSDSVFREILVTLFKILNLTTQISVIITTGLYTINNFSNLSVLSVNICYLFPMTTILSKIIFAYFKEIKMRELAERIYSPIDAFTHSSDVGVLKIICTALSYQFFDSFIYIFICISVSITTFLLANIRNHELPIKGYFPVNSTASPNYELIYSLQVYAILVNCWWVYSFDMFLLGLVRWITVDLKILQLNYRQCSFFQEPRNTLTVTEEGIKAINEFNFWSELKEEDKIYKFVPFDHHQVQVKNDSFSKRFISCLCHQQQLIKNVNDLNDLFSVVLFVQTASNCTLTCMGLFGLVGCIKKHTNPANDIVMLQIGFLNLLYWSFFGHLLIVQHDYLIDSIYTSGWENHFSDKKFAQIIINTITHGMKPIVITAGHFFDLSMQTYLQVLNKAYSFFAILNTATTEDDF